MSTAAPVEANERCATTGRARTQEVHNWIACRGTDKVDNASIVRDNLSCLLVEPRGACNPVTRHLARMPGEPGQGPAMEADKLGGRCAQDGRHHNRGRRNKEVQHMCMEIREFHHPSCVRTWNCGKSTLSTNTCLCWGTTKDYCNRTRKLKHQTLHLACSAYWNCNARAEVPLPVLQSGEHRKHDVLASCLRLSIATPVYPEPA